MTPTDINSEAARVRVGEELNSRRVESLRAELRALLGDGHRHLELDMADTQFMCSAGLGLLVETHNQVSKINGSIRLDNLTPPIRKLLRDTKLLDLFTSPESDSRRLLALEAVQEQMSHELLFLSHIQTITTNILQTSDSTAIFGQIIEAIVRSLRPRRALLALIEEGDEGRALRAAATDGLEGGFVSRINGMLLREDSLEGRCLAARKTFRYADPGLAAGESPLIEALRAKEGILQPMVGSGEALGLILLEVDSDAADFLTQSGPQLAVFANVCGLAVEKQRLLEKIKHKNRQLSKTLNDLNKTQVALSHAGKLAVASSLSRGLGHALNNKLVPIMGYAQMLCMQFDRDSPEGQKAAIIEDAAHKIKRVIDKMRTLVRRDSSAAEMNDVREVLDSCLRMMDFLFQENRIGVLREYENADGRIEFVRDSLIQAVVALFHRLPAAFRDKPENRLLRVWIERDKQSLSIHLLDNGRVFSSEEINAIQQPFDYEADQLDSERFNFSLTRGILRDQRGVFDIESSPEIGGSHVILRLPLEIKKSLGDGMLIG